MIEPTHYTARIFVPGQPEGEEFRTLELHRRWRELVPSGIPYMETGFFVDLWAPSRRFLGAFEEQTLCASACSSELDMRALDGQGHLVREREALRSLLRELGNPCGLRDLIWRLP